MIRKPNKQKIVGVWLKINALWKLKIICIAWCSKKAMIIADGRKMYVFVQ